MKRVGTERGARLPQILAAIAIACAGCSLFRGPTAQQQLYEALNRGNAAQASQIWLNMSADDRTKWMEGQGFAAGASSADLNKQIAEHYQNETMNPEGGPQKVEVGNPSVGGSGLQQLKSLSAPQAAPTGAAGTAAGAGAQ